MGTPEFAVPILQSLIDHPRINIVSVITQPDKKTGRGKTLQPSLISKLASINDIEVLKPEKIKNNQKMFKDIQNMNLDFIVVAAYGKILPKEILDIPKYGILNIHGSILPKYRGASPVNKAILNADKTTGVTLMKMDKNMDTGPIIAMSKDIKIEPGDTTGSLSEKLSNLGANVLKESIVPYLEGNLVPQEQNNSLATYTKLIQKTDGKINWNETAEYIARQIRAYQPWPSAYTFWGDKRIKLLNVQPINLNNASGPGQVIENENNLLIGTKKGILKINKLQLEGKAIISGKNFLHGYPAILNQTLS